MHPSQVEERAYEFFQSGMHCAEAALAAILASEGQGRENLVAAASAFGAGVGRSREELCGALSGSLIALGLLRGRTTPGESWDGVAAMAKDFRERFQEMHGCTVCGELLENFGPQENMEKCKRMTARAAGMMREILDREADAAPLSCGCCACSGKSADTRA